MFVDFGLDFFLRERGTRPTAQHLDPSIAPRLPCMVWMPSLECFVRDVPRDDIAHPLFGHNPLGQDSIIISGESSAADLGLLRGAEGACAAFSSSDEVVVLVLEETILDRVIDPSPHVASGRRTDPCDFDVVGDEHISGLLQPDNLPSISLRVISQDILDRMRLGLDRGKTWTFRHSYLDKVNPSSPLWHSVGHPELQSFEQAVLVGSWHAVVDYRHVVAVAAAAASFVAVSLCTLTLDGVCSRNNCAVVDLLQDNASSDLCADRLIGVCSGVKLDVFCLAMAGDEVIMKLLRK